MQRFYNDFTKCGLHELLKQLAPSAKSYLEVGTCEGNSLKVVLAANPAIEHLAICDMWGVGSGGSGRGSHDHIAALLASLGYKGSVDYLDGDSHVHLPSLVLGKYQFDLVTIDGDHQREGNFSDLVMGWNLVAPGGWITFDDVNHPQHLYLMDCANRFGELFKHSEYIESLEFPWGAVAWRKPLEDK